MARPESLEIKYQNARELANHYGGRKVLYMSITAVGLTAAVLAAAYVGETYPITKTLEQIQQGQMDAATQSALIASIGILGFEAVTVLGALAAGYNMYRQSKCNGEARRLAREIENQSRRPPTLSN